MIGLNLDAKFRQAYYHYGVLLYDYRYVAIVIPVLFTSAFALGYLRLEENMNNDHETIFSPLGSRWMTEKAAFNRQFPLRDLHSYPGRSFETLEFIDVIVSVAEGREDRNILNYLDQLRAVEEYIYSNISVKASLEGDGKEYDYFYTHLCVRVSRWESCFDNSQQIRFFTNNSREWRKYNESDFGESLLRDYTKNILESQIYVAYPKSKTSGERFYIGAVLGGVEVFGEGAWNESSAPIESAKAIRLAYTLLQDPIHRPTSKRWKAKLQEFLLSGGLPGQDLRFAVYHRDTISEGMIDIASVLIPVFSLTVVVLTAFATLCNLLLLPHHSPLIDWSRSKPVLAFLGVFTAGMGVITSHGILLSSGFVYMHIISVMPFLIISIGVDDMFIMSSAWHRTSTSLPTRERLGESMAEAAVSITITSLTDFLSFAIGCSTNLPGIRAWCAYAALAIFWNYVYQITFFAAMMGVFGDLEAAGYHGALLVVKTEEYDHKKPILRRLLLSGSHLNKQDVIEQSVISKFFRRFYGPFLNSWPTKLATLALYAAYLGGAIAGCFYIGEGMDVRGLVRKNFYVIHYADVMEETFFKQGEQLHVLVEKPPELNRTEGREKYEEIIQAFCNTQHSMSREFVESWLDTYMEHLAKLDRHNTTYEFYDEIRNSWLKTTPRKDAYTMDITWSNDSRESTEYLQMNATRFFVGLKNFRNPLEQKRATLLFRAIADRFSEYQVYTYHHFYPYADWYILLVPTTFRNIGIALACMAVVSVFLIPNFPAALLVAVAVVSIDLGVIGYMAHWSVKLDCISAMTLLMSIGFAVDLTAHITYAFITAKGDPGERVTHALETLGSPILQGGVSTIIGMLILLTVEASMMGVFVKTTFLVIFFGLVHSLVFIPVALSVFHPFISRFDSFEIGAKKPTENTGNGHVKNGAEKFELASPHT